MPISYSFDPSLRLVMTFATGEVSFAEIRDHIGHVMGEPWFPAPALVDTRGASADIPGEEVRQIVELLGSLASAMHATPIAVLVPSDLAYGLVRMIGLLLGDRLSIVPFHDAAPAMSWLQKRLDVTLPPAG